MATINISEIYKSVQGEGRLTGVESVFVRVSGCNLRCWFCDTPFASWSPEGSNWTVDNLIEEIQKLKVRHVVLTGGEPMLFPAITDLTESLKKLSYHVTIETAGTIFQPVKCDLMSISPKLQNSDPSQQKAGKWALRHQETRNQPKVIGQMTQSFDCQFKFVLDCPEDVEQVEQFLDNCPGIHDHEIWLMPQGTVQSELAKKEVWLAELCEEKSWKLCSRKHIEWFGFKRGV